MSKLQLKHYSTLLIASAILLTGVTQAQANTMKDTTTVSSTKAGTKKKPKGVQVKFKGKINYNNNQEKPTNQTLEFYLPKGFVYAGQKLPKGAYGKKLPVCNLNKLTRGLPTRVCPRGSVIGKGTSTALADTVKTRIKYTLVNGGKNIWLYTQMTNPMVIQTPIKGTVKKVKGKHSYKVSFDIPKSIQTLAGTNISILDYDIKLNSRKIFYTTSCPKNKKWEFKTRTKLSTNQTLSSSRTIKCK